MLSTIRSIVARGLAIAAIVGTTAFQPPSPKVYICDSATSYAYHLSRSCSGLAHCKHQILVTTKDIAVNTYGRQPCKICVR